MDDKEKAAAEKAAQEKAAEEAKKLNLEKLQSNFDELSERVRKAEEKAKNQELRAKKAESRLRELNTDKGQPSPELDEIKQLLEIEKEKNEQLLAKTKESDRNKQLSDVTMAIRASKTLKPDVADMVQKLVLQATDVRNGQTVVLTDENTVKLSPAGVPMTPQEYLTELLSKTPSLAIPNADGGRGDTGNKSGAKIISMDEYESMSSIARATYRASLSEEEKNQLFNNIK